MAFCSSENCSEMINDLLCRTTPVVAFIDCDKLWTNIMNETVSTKLKNELPIREAIKNYGVHYICINHGKSNSADGTTKATPNKMLVSSIQKTNLKRHEKSIHASNPSFRHAIYINISSIPMLNDIKDITFGKCWCIKTDIWNIFVLKLI